MKIFVDSEMVIEIKDIHRKVIENDIMSEIFDADIKRRIQWIILHKYERCFERLKNEWMPKLKERMATIPTDDEALAQLIISQPDYKNRSAREEEKNAV